MLGQVLTGNVGHATFVKICLEKAFGAPILTDSFSADRFNVSLPFLSQQAALLYERQLSQVRAGLQKANRLSSGASPTPGSTSGSGTTGGYAMTRGGSGGIDRSICYSAFANPAKDRESRPHYHKEPRSERHLMVKQVQKSHE